MVNPPADMPFSCHY